MNQKEIEIYVSEYLKGATVNFLREIVDHGIYNTGADIISAADDYEYKLIGAVFKEQAAEKLEIAGKTYMNVHTGSVDTYDGWYYTNQDGETVNAVDLHEVVEVVKDQNGAWVEA